MVVHAWHVCRPWSPNRTTRARQAPSTSLPHPSRVVGRTASRNVHEPDTPGPPPSRETRHDLANHVRGPYHPTLHRGDGSRKGAGGGRRLELQGSSARVAGLLRGLLAYSEDSEWRNHDEFFQGREAIRAFLTRKWKKELDYKLMKELWAFTGNHISVRFELRVARRRRPMVPHAWERALGIQR